MRNALHLTALAIILFVVLDTVGSSMIEAFGDALMFIFQFAIETVGSIFSIYL